MQPELDRRQTVDERLEQIKAVTDTALASLDVDDMLVELLDRVIAILDADTAAVLLADTSGRELVASAARGLEEEVRQGVRIPIGRGFAGRVAAEARPIILDRVDATTVSNPILWQKGIRSMLGVPLRTGDAVIGVLHVGTLGDRRFGENDIVVIGGGRRADRRGDPRPTSSRPTAMRPQPCSEASCRARRRGWPELEFAARYVPAERGGLGGDWYDVFRLDNGDIWVVAGDVAGHGLRAAVVMGRIRSALRAYALLDIPPDEVLRLTSRKIDHFELGQMATCAIAVISPPYDTARMVLAGHPPVVAARPGEEARLVEACTVGPPTRSGPGETSRGCDDHGLADPGDVLFFYTVGLIEQTRTNPSTRDWSASVGR